MNEYNPNFSETDLLNFLRVTPLSKLTYEQRCELKNKRPTPKLNIKQSVKKFTRSFQSSWYERFSWLTGCSVKNKMYCYVCILFDSKDTEWCTEGISDLSNLIKKAVKHQSSKEHLKNKESFQMLGKHRIEHAISEALRLSNLRHNETVSLNRQILRRIIQAIIFLCKQELPFRGHLEDESSHNRGNYLELLNLLAQNESLMRDHLESSSAFKGTSPDIQNDLIEIITGVLNDKIKSEIGECSFISIQADETLDVSCKSQMSIIFRYCIKDKIQERFMGFYDVSKNKKAIGLSEIIRKVLNEWNVDLKKVICQTYDGASVMAGSEGGVQKHVRQFCPHALFIHCYAHQLNLVLLHGSKSIPQVRLFICALTAFHSFFSKSSKRSVLLTERGFKLPQASTTRWNFHSRAVSTIIKYFSELNNVFNVIIADADSEWDSDSVNCAVGLVRYLEDPKFVFLLRVYENCFIYIDSLFKVLQSLSVNILTVHNEINLAIANLALLRQDSFIDKCVDDSLLLNKTLRFSEIPKKV